MLKQISVFAENKIGTMEKLTSLVSDAGIDFYNVVTNDSAEYGIIRMICSDPEKAAQILTDAGYMCKINLVLGVCISESVGSLSSLLKTVHDIRVNIDYLYVCYIRSSTDPVAILHVTDWEDVEDSLGSLGYKTL
ncbi:MAG: amino acid-binding protein [Bilifractor sp.]|jgi:hypothetical protein